MSTINGISGIRDYGFSPPQVKESPMHRAWQKTHTVFLTFRDKIWPYAKGAIQMTKQGLRIAATKLHKFEPKLLRAITFLGLTSAVGALLTLSKYPSLVKDLLVNFNLKDIEGVVFSGLSLLASPLDILDSTITFLQSASVLGVIPVIAVFSIIALPISITLLGYAMVRGIYDLVQAGINKQQIASQVDTEDEINQLRAVLEKKLLTEDTKQPKRLDERKIKVLTRHTDKRVVQIMQTLLEKIQQEAISKEKINESLSDIHTLMRRKITVGVSETIANTALLSTLVALAITPISPLVFPIMALMRGTFALGKMVYMEKFFTRGLHNQI